MLKHQPSTFATALDQLEDVIEAIDPATAVNLDDVFKAAGTTKTNQTVKAAAMLLQKYGIEFWERRKQY